MMILMTLDRPWERKRRLTFVSACVCHSLSLVRHSDCHSVSDGLMFAPWFFCACVCPAFSSLQCSSLHSPLLFPPLSSVHSVNSCFLSPLLVCLFHCRFFSCSRDWLIHLVGLTRRTRQWSTVTSADRQSWQKCFSRCLFPCVCLCGGVKSVGKTTNQPSWDLCLYCYCCVVILFSCSRQDVLLVDLVRPSSYFYGDSHVLANQLSLLSLPFSLIIPSLFPFFTHTHTVCPGKTISYTTTTGQHRLPK